MVAAEIGLPEYHSGAALMVAYLSAIRSNEPWAVSGTLAFLFGAYLYLKSISSANADAKYPLRTWGATLGAAGCFLMLIGVLDGIQIPALGWRSSDNISPLLTLTTLCCTVGFGLLAVAAAGKWGRIEVRTPNQTRTIPGWAAWKLVAPGQANFNARQFRLRTILILITLLAPLMALLRNTGIVGWVGALLFGASLFWGQVAARRVELWRRIHGLTLALAMASLGLPSLLLSISLSMDSPYRHTFLGSASSVLAGASFLILCGCTMHMGTFTAQIAPRPFSFFGAAYACLPFAYLLLSLRLFTIQ